MNAICDGKRVVRVFLGADRVYAWVSGARGCAWGGGARGCAWGGGARIAFMPGVAGAERGGGGGAAPGDQPRVPRINAISDGKRVVRVFLRADRVYAWVSGAMSGARAAAERE